MNQRVDKPYRILLLTSDKYIWSIPHYAYFLKKNWPSHPDVVIGGFTEPRFDLPEGFSFHSIGDFNDYPVGKWSDSLIKFLNDMPDEVFLFTLEDMWIVNHVDVLVNERTIDMCFDYMNQFSYVARFDLTSDRLYAGGAQFYGKLDMVDIVFSDPDSQYHLSTMPAFWRKEHLLSALVPNETPWQVELQGTPRLGSMRDSKIVLGTNVSPLKIHLAFRSGNPGKLLLDGISSDDIRNLRSMGLLEEYE